MIYVNQSFLPCSKDFQMFVFNLLLPLDNNITDMYEVYIMW